MPRSYSCFSTWTRYTHPEGQLYYSCNVQVGNRVNHTYLTEEDLTNDSILGDITCLTNEVETVLRNRKEPDEIYVVFQKYDDEGNWLHYMTDSRKSFFWLDDHDIEWIADVINGIPDRDYTGKSGEL